MAITAAEISWFLDGKPLSAIETIVIEESTSDNSSKLFIRQLPTSSTSAVSFVAKRGKDEVTGRCEVSVVEDVPRIKTKLPESHACAEGETLSLEFELEPEQTCDVQWSLNGKTLKKTNKVGRYLSTRC